MFFDKIENIIKSSDDILLGYHILRKIFRKEQLLYDLKYDYFDKIIVPFLKIDILNVYNEDDIDRWFDIFSMFKDILEDRHETVQEEEFINLLKKNLEVEVIKV